MSRANPAQVTQLVDTDRSVDLFIEIANNLVDEHLLSSSLTATQLKHIEIYLAAHFAAVTEERGSIVRSSVGDAAETYQDIYESGLRSTRFGQQAIALDTSGTLAGLASSKVRAQFRVI